MCVRSNRYGGVIEKGISRGKVEEGLEPTLRRSKKTGEIKGKKFKRESGGILGGKAINEVVGVES